MSRVILVQTDWICITLWSIRSELYLGWSHLNIYFLGSVVDAKPCANKRCVHSQKGYKMSVKGSGLDIYD